MYTFFSGFSISLSLILAIGAQNAFVLRQGLRKEHVFIICLICALSDATLITIGVSGFHVLIRHAPWIDPVMRYGGAIFLIWYGAKSAYTAFRSGDSLIALSDKQTKLSTALLTCLALTWLNPHVYLDTVIFLGTISTQFIPHQYLFGLGAITASFIFFFSLGYGAALLRPVFSRPSTWRILEGVIALVMWAIALKLVLYV